jgi:thiamine biosynthesis lipoprotein
VGIRHPRDERAVVTELDPRGMAVATSGDYEQFFVQEGVRYHHIFDPVTARPARASMSVTVLAHDDTWADALATGIFVLGAERGLTLAERLPGVEVLIVDSAGVQHRTPGFHRYEMTQHP